MTADRCQGLHLHHWCKQRFSCTESLVGLQPHTHQRCKCKPRIPTPRLVLVISSRRQPGTQPSALRFHLSRGVPKHLSLPAQKARRGYPNQARIPQACNLISYHNIARACGSLAPYLSCAFAARVSCAFGAREIRRHALAPSVQDASSAKLN